MENRVHHISIRGKIILVFLVIMMVSILVMGIYAVHQMYNSLMTNTYRNMNLMIESTGESISDSFSMIENATIALSASESVTEWLEDSHYFDEDNEAYYLNVQKLNYEFQKTLTYNNVWKLNLLSYVTVYQNQQLLGSTYTKQVSMKKIAEDSVLAVEAASQYPDRFIQLIPPTAVSPTFFITRKLKSDFTSDDHLLIVAAIEEAYIRALYKGLMADEGALVYLVNEQGTIVSSNSQAELGMKISSEVWSLGLPLNREERQFQEHDYVAVSRELDANKFRLIYLIPKANLVKEAFDSMQNFLLVLIMLAILFIVLAIIVSMKTTSFVLDITTAMDRVRKKDYSVRLPEYRDPNLDGLSRSFNTMTEEIQELIHSKYESQLLLHEMEIKALQHQMNPHFLFNVLLTVQIKAKMSGNETIYKMIESLSALLRAGISGDKRRTIMIQEELKLTEFYLSLQKMRYEERLSYQIIVMNDELNQCEIPRLVIEPIVENAVVHGVEKIAEPANIFIYVKDEGENICIEVTDNGNGFDVDAMIGKGESPMEQHGNEHIGLRNTDQRLKLMYGQAYGLKIISEDQAGTSVYIKIPKKRKLNDESNDC
ncbi:hypothetical protein SANA_00800 [Gottschalkiaceae bacterium SANA]|nr:hypothetical protein SANA_00800 [Gottschalkiaceae bacterium SANA]